MSKKRTLTLTEGEAAVVMGSTYWDILMELVYQTSQGAEENDKEIWNYILAEIQYWNNETYVDFSEEE